LAIGATNYFFLISTGCTPCRIKHWCLSLLHHLNVALHLGHLTRSFLGNLSSSELLAVVPFVSALNASVAAEAMLLLLKIANLPFIQITHMRGFAILANQEADRSSLMNVMNM
jgi:hypothetical protein